MLATATVPAYAASSEEINEYTFSASVSGNYTYTQGGCNYPYGNVTGLYFESTTAVPGDSPGFSVPEVNGAETTDVYLDNVKLMVAFPSNLIYALDLTQGNYSVSGPTRTSIPGADYESYDVFTLTFTGPTVGTSVSDRNTPWSGSEFWAEASVDNTLCIPDTDIVAYWRFTGGYTTENGYAMNLDNGWHSFILTNR